ncbi:Neurogenic locus Notch protein [Gryllus bimaculatus]|nr:Neurogenic locus Notch protein [Gryllus bimaculatus]
MASPRKGGAGPSRRAFRLQEALRLQRQEAERKEERASAALREMERKLQEKDAAIRVFCRQRLEERLTAVEERTTGGCAARLGGRVEKSGAEVHARVDALLRHLEKPNRTTFLPPPGKQRKGRRRNARGGGRSSGKWRRANLSHPAAAVVLSGVRAHRLRRGRNYSDRAWPRSTPAGSPLCTWVAIHGLQAGRGCIADDGGADVNARIGTERRLLHYAGAGQATRAVRAAARAGARRDSAGADVGRTRRRLTLRRLLPRRTSCLGSREQRERERPPANQGDPSANRGAPAPPERTGRINRSRDGTDAVSNAFQLLQATLRLEKQEAERKDAGGPAPAGGESDNGLQEKDDAIRALQQRLEETEERVPWRRGGPGTEDRLEGRVNEIEASLQSAVETFVPRVEALLRQLEKPKSARASLATAAVATSAAIAREAPATGVEPPSSTPTPTPTPSGAGHQGAAADEEQRARRREELRWDRAQTSPSPLEAGRLNSGADVNYTGRDGFTPLRNAAWQAHADVVAFLLQRGANANSVNCNGSSALHLAAGTDKSGRCVELLVDAGADVNARDENGMTALHWAAFNSNQETRRQERPQRCPFDLATSRAVQDLLRGPLTFALQGTLRGRDDYGGRNEKGREEVEREMEAGRGRRRAEQRVRVALLARQHSETHVVVQSPP